jgi:hypothetical protein
MSQPFGQWLVGLGGALIIGLGFYQFYQSLQSQIRKHLKLQEMSPTEETWAMRLGSIWRGRTRRCFCDYRFFPIRGCTSV